MRIIISMMFVLAMLTSFACSKKKKMQKLAGAGFVWMQYDETKCENPWQFNWLVAPTDEQLATAVKSHLEGGGIKIIEIKTSRAGDDFISCEACNCPNGFHYFVKVNKTEVAKLKELKFFEASQGKIPK